MRTKVLLQRIGERVERARPKEFGFDFSDFFLDTNVFDGDGAELQSTAG